MADLPTNLKDDILNSSVNTRRKYRMIENGDGTYSFEDATEYIQVGDGYGAGLINETNRQVNARVEKAVVVRDLETIGAITQPGFIPDALALKDVNRSLGGLQFGIDENGNYGYIKVGADSVTPFSSFNNMIYAVPTTANQVTKVATITIPEGVTRGLLVGIGSGMASAQYTETPLISVDSTGVVNYDEIATTDKIFGNVSNIPMYLSMYMVNTIPNGTIVVTASSSGNSCGLCAVFLY